jgi:predicted DNA-binding ribbon-helix-helix protein
VRRTQLYLDDDLWTVLHQSAARSGTTVSQLVRDAVRDRYLGKLEARAKAMREFVGIRKDRKDEVDSTEYVRSIRSGTRLERLAKQ